MEEYGSQWAYGRNIMEIGTSARISHERQGLEEADRV